MAAPNICLEKNPSVERWYSRRCAHLYLSMQVCALPSSSLFHFSLTHASITLPTETEGTQALPKNLCHVVCIFSSWWDIAAKCCLGGWQPCVVIRFTAVWGQRLSGMCKCKTSTSLKYCLYSCDKDTGSDLLLFGPLYLRSFHFTFQVCNPYSRFLRHLVALSWWLFFLGMDI